jgi:GNAT superfamily N-acetyltransferase
MIIKDRCFYELTDYASDPIDDDVVPASVNDLKELVTMFQSYYIEEYNGERDKTADFLLPSIKRSILNESLYLLKVRDVITSFCSIIDPDIGIIFTKVDYRGQGLGRRLLEYCSSLLFGENGVAYLMTDKHNLASNIICKKIGYQLIYEHTNLKI